MKAHKKGSAITLIFDPYQIDSHQHIRCSGFGKLGKLVKSASNNLVNSAKDELNEKRELLYQMDRLESKGFKLPFKFMLSSLISSS